MQYPGVKLDALSPSYFKDNLKLILEDTVFMIVISILSARERKAPIQAFRDVDRLTEKLLEDHAQFHFCFLPSNINYNWSEVSLTESGKSLFNHTQTAPY